MIFVTGMSSSGKTHTLERLVRVAPSFRHVRASAILRSLGRPILDLTVEAAVANQHALVAELLRLGFLSDEDAVLDGHATVETTSGTLLLPDETFDALAPRAVVHIEASPTLISERSALRGQSWNLAEATDRQKAERNHAWAQASRLGVPFYKVASGDVNALLRCAADVSRHVPVAEPR